MFPIFFLGALGFLFSTLIRNGAGTAAVMVLIGLIVWISSGILGESEWNIFLNPYDMPDSLSPVVWLEMLFYNRLYLIIGSVLAILGALFRLQKREKFM
jgi:ABC-type Na+ transport system ATPase subunit NatA